MTVAVGLLVSLDPPEGEFIVVNVTDDEMELPGHSSNLLKMPWNPTKTESPRRRAMRNKKYHPTQDYRGRMKPPMQSDIDPEILGECKKRGRSEIARRKGIEKALVQPTGPAFYQQLATAQSADIHVMVDHAVAAETSQRCLKDHDLSARDWEPCSNPTDRPDCSTSSHGREFRWLQGTCNNKRNPLWGSAMQPFRRILPAEYEDGLSQPRPAFPVGIIPPPRQVSICMQNATNQWDEPRLSMLFVHFAHFLDHDINFIAPYKGKYFWVLLGTLLIKFMLFFKVSMAAPSRAAVLKKIAIQSATRSS